MSANYSRAKQVSSGAEIHHPEKSKLTCSGEEEIEIVSANSMEK